MPFARMFASVIGRPELLLLGAISWLKPSAWAPIKAQLRLKDDGALAVYRQRYLEGVPKRTVAEEAADARILYRRSPEVGGQELVGKAKGLDTGLFYDPATGE
jgi:NitT/TauT family transport system substrate-binding protein